jgi:hypothetical protein
MSFDAVSRSARRPCARSVHRHGAALERLQEITDADPFRVSGVVRHCSLQRWSLSIGAERFRP